MTVQNTLSLAIVPVIETIRKTDWDGENETRGFHHRAPEPDGPSVTFWEKYIK